MIIRTIRAGALPLLSDDLAPRGGAVLPCGGPAAARTGP
ncbi:protein of unassigned function [Methylobacterium oryzae CBMB20]|uniref:Protein of unassigned function n=1 Tax=Methylobacterium oryzae CBMB20 TaxID=693986 RepID=A0A089P2N7_9HYPH|nr:protein of unassigned function [Methylobacterium oryzae CBMB20]